MSTYICPRYERALRRQELSFRSEEGVILTLHRQPKDGVEQLLDINWTASGAAAGYPLPGDYWQKAAIDSAARKLANVATYGTPTGPQPAKVPMKAPMPAAASMQEQLAEVIPQRQSTAVTLDLEDLIGPFPSPAEDAMEFEAPTKAGPGTNWPRCCSSRLILVPRHWAEVDDESYGYQLLFKTWTCKAKPASPVGPAWFDHHQVRRGPDRP